MISALVAGLALASVAFGAPTKPKTPEIGARAVGTSVTPHAQWSSSIGVLGCKVNTNRIAYFPMQPDCNNLCLKVSANGRSVHLLHVDTSGGAHDISYDAWNYLVTGRSATEQPTMGGGIAAEYEFVDMSNCGNLLKEGNLPLMAANSINFFVSCPANSWVGRNAALFNIQTSGCTLGYDERCTLDLNISNQPTCPHQLGLQSPLTGHTVYDIEYGTGKLVPVIQ
ncbi:hypothetical protein GQ43DRAFT_192258 [Delitschia confertaspora ATCC 74209]|uniref:Cerato-platanin n=1 Tax=Delitschia confertaspora ATCC 74209 TaxID=1513339 RepID=A0A9P4MVL1_9PLEO|nr:hypothetical protein GQ43DRAFT_192258 [Delitschia confertaspora ATCC 74209]